MLDLQIRPHKPENIFETILRLMTCYFKYRNKSVKTNTKNSQCVHEPTPENEKLVEEDKTRFNCFKIQENREICLNLQTVHQVSMTTTSFI